MFICRHVLMVLLYEKASKSLFLIHALKEFVAGIIIIWHNFIRYILLKYTKLKIYMFNILHFFTKIICLIF